MQGQHSTDARSSHTLSRTENRAASAHIAQAKLLIRRAAGETRDPLQVRTLRDLAGVLQFLIEQLEATR
jgi:hypothetical protein